MKLTSGNKLGSLAFSVFDGYMGSKPSPCNSRRGQRSLLKLLQFLLLLQQVLVAFWRQV
jgi:hypothetical protein